MGKQKGAKEHAWTMAEVRWARKAKDNGWTWAQIARKLGVSEHSVSQAVYRMCR